MRLRRVVRLSFLPVDLHGTVDMPDNAGIVAVEWRTDGGLEFQRQPSGVWIETVEDRYDEHTGTSIIRDELPPPNAPPVAG